MAQITYRANLSAAIYPMALAEGGRTVIVPGPDNNYDRRLDPSGEQRNAGIPQALYLENVIPTSNGYQSVGYVKTTQIVTNGTSYLADVFEIYARHTSDEIIKKIPLFRTGLNTYTTTGFVGIFQPIVVVGTPLSGGQITSAVVRGIAYVLSAGNLYTVTVSPFFVVTFTDITASVTPLNFFTTNNIRGICGSNNYLIAHNSTTVFHSSTTTPTDFVSSLVSGSGSIAPNDSDNYLLYCKQVASGFYLFTPTTILFAQYTGNIRYPFRFTPVKGSTGISPYGSRFNHVISGDATSDALVVIEHQKQIKLLIGTEAKTVAPEVIEFLNQTSVQAVFDSNTNTFSENILYTPQAHVYQFLNRYIVISINHQVDFALVTPQYQFSHAIIFDRLTQRYGKLKVLHNFIFQSPPELSPLLPLSGLPETPFLGFVNVSEAICRYIDFDIYPTRPVGTGYTREAHSGVLLLGKFQYARSRFMQMNEIEIEGPQNTAIIPTPNFSCHLLPSLDGRNLDPAISPTQVYNSGGVVKYACLNVAQNHSLLMKGAFSVNTVQLKFRPAGQN